MMHWGPILGATDFSAPSRHAADRAARVTGLCALLKADSVQIWSTVTCSKERARCRSVIVRHGWVLWWSNHGLHQIPETDGICSRSADGRDQQVFELICRDGHRSRARRSQRDWADNLRWFGELQFCLLPDQSHSF